MTERVYLTPYMDRLLDETVARLKGQRLHEEASRVRMAQNVLRVAEHDRQRRERAPIFNSDEHHQAQLMDNRTVYD